MFLETQRRDLKQQRRWKLRVTGIKQDVSEENLSQVSILDFTRWKRNAKETGIKKGFPRGITIIKSNHFLLHNFVLLDIWFYCASTFNKLYSGWLLQNLPAQAFVRGKLKGAFRSKVSLVAQLVKNPPVMQETLVWFLGWEDPLEKGTALENGMALENGTATHSSILAWRSPWTAEPGRLQFMGLQRVRHNWATFTFQI